MKRIYWLACLIAVVLFPANVYSTVSVETSRVQYSCNGITTTYTYPFEILEDDDLLAIKTDGSSTETTLVLNVDYTVTGAGSTTGGTLVLTAASKCASGYTLTMLRNVDVTQETDYVDGEAFSAESLENALDKMALVQQQQAEEIDRALKLKKSSTLSNIDVPVDGGKVIGWNSSGTALSTYSTSAASTTDFDNFSNYSGFNTAISSIGATEQAVVCNTAQTLTASVAVPNNAQIVALKGCAIDTTGYTLTINGHLEAGQYQVFSGTGSVVFGYGSVDKIQAAWFGATGDNSTDDGPAIQLAIDSAIASSGTKHVQLHGGIFRSSVSLEMYGDGLVLEGVGSSWATGTSTPSTKILFTGVLTDGISLVDGVTNYARGRIAHITVHGGSVVDNGIKVASANILEDINVTGCLVDGIRLNTGTNGTHLNHINSGYNTGNGIGVYGGSSTTVYSISNSNFRVNGGAGGYFEGGQNVTVINTVFESNVGNGVWLYRNASTWGGIHFINCWMENNATTGDKFQFKATSDSPNSSTSVVRGITLDYVSMSTAATGKYIYAPSIRDLEILYPSFSSSTEDVTDSVVFYDAGYGTSSAYYVTVYTEDLTYNVDFAPALVSTLCAYGNQHIKTTSGVFDSSPVGIRGTTGGYYRMQKEAYVNITAVASPSIAVNIPTGSKIIGVQLRVDAALAAGETWNAAYAGGSTQTVAHEEPVTLNTKINVPFDGLDTAGTLTAQAVWASPVTTATTTITIQRHSNPGVDVFTAQGTIRAIVYYEGMVAMGNAP